MKHCYKIYFHRMTLQAAEFSFSMCCEKNRCVYIMKPYYCFLLVVDGEEDIHRFMGYIGISKTFESR